MKQAHVLRNIYSIAMLLVTPYSFTMHQKSASTTLQQAEIIFTQKLTGSYNYHNATEETPQKIADILSNAYNTMQELSQQKDHTPEFTQLFFNAFFVNARTAITACDTSLNRDTVHETLQRILPKPDLLS